MCVSTGRDFVLSRDKGREEAILEVDRAVTGIEGEEAEK